MYAADDYDGSPIIGLENFEGQLPTAVNIGVVGIGGAGCNSLNTLAQVGVTEATTIGINTDLQHLRKTKADKRVLIGHKLTKGRGAGGDAGLAQKCAEEDLETLSQVLEGLDMVFISAGLGGGTGTGVAPVVARLARKQGALVFATVTTPFKTEGQRRRALAAAGLKRLQGFCDCLIPLQNDKLHELVPRYSLRKAFEVMDDLITQMIKSVVETITEASDINVDFNDLRTVLDRAGESVILYGHSLSEQPNKVVNKVLNNPMLNLPPDGGQAALIHVTCGSNFSLNDCEEVIQGVASQLSQDALIIRGNRILKEPSKDVKVVAVIAGLPIMTNHFRPMAPSDQPTIIKNPVGAIAQAEVVSMPPPPGPDRCEVPWIN